MNFFLQISAEFMHQSLPVVFKIIFSPLLEPLSPTELQIISQPHQFWPFLWKSSLFLGLWLGLRALVLWLKFHFG